MRSWARRYLTGKRCHTSHGPWTVRSLRNYGRTLRGGFGTNATPRMKKQTHSGTRLYAVWVGRKRVWTIPKTKTVCPLLSALILWKCTGTLLEISRDWLIVVSIYTAYGWMMI